MHNGKFSFLLIILKYFRKREKNTNLFIPFHSSLTMSIKKYFLHLVSFVGVLRNLRQALRIDYWLWSKIGPNTRIYFLWKICDKGGGGGGVEIVFFA